MCEIELLLSDNPTVLDQEVTYEQLPNVQGVGKDPIHIPLKVEQASREHKTLLSNRLRRCVLKFRNGLDDGKPYGSKYRSPQTYVNLQKLRATMALKTAKRRLKCIDNEKYPTEPYASANDFVKDVAALTIIHSDQMRRSTGKSTVLGSIDLHPYETCLYQQLR